MQCLDFFKSVLFFFKSALPYFGLFSILNMDNLSASFHLLVCTCTQSVSETAKPNVNLRSFMFFGDYQFSVHSGFKSYAHFPITSSISIPRWQVTPPPQHMFALCTALHTQHKQTLDWHLAAVITLPRHTINASTWGILLPYWSVMTADSSIICPLSMSFTCTSFLQ